MLSDWNIDSRTSGCCGEPARKAARPPTDPQASLHPWVEPDDQLNPRFHPRGDVDRGVGEHDRCMTTTDYLIDGALVLLVLLQIKERPLTDRLLVRPLIIVAIAVVA